MSRGGGRVNHERLNAREAARAEQPLYNPNRKTRTTEGQKTRLAELGRELGREVTVPAMAYDARLEIDRLERRLATKRRLGI